MKLSGKASQHGYAGPQHQDGVLFTDCFRVCKYFAHHVQAFGVGAEPAIPLVWTEFSDKNVLQRSPTKIKGLTKKQRLLVADDAYRAEVAAIETPQQGASKPAAAGAAAASAVASGAKTPKGSVQQAHSTPKGSKVSRKTKSSSSRKARVQAVKPF